MPPLQIAIPTHRLNLPLKESLRVAAEMGARGVQFDVRNELKPGDLSETGRRQFLHQLAERGLQVASLYFPTRRTYLDEAELDARVAATKAAMTFARQLQTAVVTVRLGQIPSDKESRPYRLLRDVVGDLARHGNQSGVTLALTPLHDAPETLIEFVTSITTGPLGIDFDPAAFVIAGHNPDAALRSVYHLMVHMQARDAIRDIDGGLEVALGRGEVDWIALLPLLDEISYAGWVTVNRTQGADLPGDIARGVKFLQNVLLQ